MLSMDMRGEDRSCLDNFGVAYHRTYSGNKLSRKEGGNAMPTVQVPAQLTVEHLMAAVKQFSPDELHEFKTGNSQHGRDKMASRLSTKRG